MHSTRPEHQPLTTLHLDRGYDYGAVKTTAVNHGIDDVVCAKRRKRGAAAADERMTRIELALSAWEADVLPLNYTRGGSRA